MTRRRRLQFAALRRRAGRDGISGHLPMPNLPNLHSFRSTRLCRVMPLKSVLKFDLKCRPPQKAKLGRKWTQMGAQNRLDLA